MAKNTDREHKTLADAADELSWLLVQLHKCKVKDNGIYLAQMLFKYGFEGGSLVASIGDIKDKDTKIELINHATIKLNQTAYILGAMRDAKYYKASDTDEILEYLQDMTGALREMLNGLSVRQPNENIVPVKATPVKTVAPVKTATPVKREVVPQKAVVRSRDDDDDDGFGDEVVRVRKTKK
jgi:hypothetical protein